MGVGVDHGQRGTTGAIYVKAGHTQMIERDFAQTLARGLALMEAMSVADQYVSTSEVAAKIGVSRAAARRLLLTLHDLGYADTDGRHYWLTPKVLSFGRGLVAGNSIWSLISRDIVELADRFNEPCSVSVLDGLDIVYVSRDVTRRIYTSRLSVGDRLPANCCASGKLLLAALDSKELQARVKRFGPMEARTARSLKDLTALKKELSEVRERGWAVADGEMEDDIVSIAVPIRDQSNAVVAAISIASHRGRQSAAELTSATLGALQEAAVRAGDIFDDVSRRGGQWRDLGGEQARDQRMANGEGPLNGGVG